MSIKFVEVPKSDKDVYLMTLSHYSETRGFVARTIIYKIYYDGILYGAIVAGSATKHLPGRTEFLGSMPLNNIVNNTFFHIEKQHDKYPCRNFTSSVLRHFRYAASVRWQQKYGDGVFAFESLVELPRTGELYRRDGWTEVGITKGQTARRWAESIMGPSTDNWGGTRVWSKTNLRPKRVMVRFAE